MSQQFQHKVDYDDDTDENNHNTYDHNQTMMI